MCQFIKGLLKVNAELNVQPTELVVLIQDKSGYWKSQTEFVLWYCEEEQTFLLKFNKVTKTHTLLFR